MFTVNDQSFKFNNILLLTNIYKVYKHKSIRYINTICSYMSNSDTIMFNFIKQNEIGREF